VETKAREGTGLTYIMIKISISSLYLRINRRITQSSVAKTSELQPETTTATLRGIAVCHRGAYRTVARVESDAPRPIAIAAQASRKRVMSAAIGTL